MAPEIPGAPLALIDDFVLVSILNLASSYENVNYNYYFGKLCKWHFVVQQDLEQHPESPRTVFNFNLLLLADISTK